jgi:fructokinase
MVIVVGEILFDHFPTYRRLGGAPFNFAYHLKCLGIPVRFISRIGRDRDGKEILATLTQQGFNVDDIQIDDNYHTGYVTITEYPKRGPLFIIHPNVAYDYLALSNTLLKELSEESNFIYFGSLVQRTAHGFNAIQRFFSSKTPGDKCLCDINLRPDCYDMSIILKSLQQADLLKLNENELEIIGQMIGKHTNRAELIEHLMEHYELEIVSLTKGNDGSELFVAGKRYVAETDKIDSIADTVGAGDAYAAMLAIGYLKGWDPNRILTTATRFSGKLCTVQGAIPHTGFYDEFRHELDL